MGRRERQSAGGGVKFQWELGEMEAEREIVGMLGVRGDVSPSSFCYVGRTRLKLQSGAGSGRKNSYGVYRAPAVLAKGSPGRVGHRDPGARAGCSVPTALSLGAVSAELLLSGKLSEYGVIVPFSTDCRGRFLSHVVSGDAAAGLGQPACPPDPDAFPSRRRVPRSPPDEPPQRRLLYFNVTVFGKELHLRLRPNRRLVPPGAVAEWQEDFEVLFREPLQQRCLFTGDISGMPGAAVAISNCDGLVSWRLAEWFVCGACVLVWFPLKR